MQPTIVSRMFISQICALFQFAFVPLMPWREDRQVQAERGSPPLGGHAIVKIGKKLLMLLLVVPAVAMASEELGPSAEAL